MRLFQDIRPKTSLRQPLPPPPTHTQPRDRIHVKAFCGKIDIIRTVLSFKV